jgi:hypothetical protein
MLRNTIITIGLWLLLSIQSSSAQALAPEFVKISDGIHVYSIKRVDRPSN